MGSLKTRVTKLESQSDGGTSVEFAIAERTKMAQRGEPIKPSHPDEMIPLLNKVRRVNSERTGVIREPLTEKEELEERERYAVEIEQFNKDMAKYQARREQILSLSKDGLTIDEITRTLRDKGDSIPESQIRAIIAEENTDAKHSNENR